jgi:iron complex transport system permease protein
MTALIGAAAFAMFAILIGAGCGAVDLLPAIGVNWMLSCGADRIGPGDTELATRILMQIRLPRVAGGFMVGAALAAAGVLYQGLLRNPLADPFVIGASGGAGLGIVLGQILLVYLGSPGGGGALVPGLGFVGALAAVWMVFLIAGRRGRRSNSTLVLTGFAVSSLLGALNLLILLTAQPLRERLLESISWVLGGVKVSGWTPIGMAFPAIAICLVVGFSLARQLDYLALGGAGAVRLGVNVDRLRIALLCAASLLTAVAVALAGIVALVGLLVPHVVRLVLGPANRLLLPVAAILGGAYLVLVDLVARTAFAPAEIPVGILAAVLGTPVFLWLLRRHRFGYDF